MESCKNIQNISQTSKSLRWLQNRLKNENLEGRDEFRKTYRGDGSGSKNHSGGRKLSEKFHSSLSFICFCFFLGGIGRETRPMSTIPESALLVGYMENVEKISTAVEVTHGVSEKIGFKEGIEN